MPDDTSIPVLRQRVESGGGPLGAGSVATGKTLELQSKVRGAARSLYIHVPFCFHKCHYCDFYSIVDTRDRQGVFVERLVRELRAIAPFAGRLGTVFVGGGTPSLLRVELWRELLRVLRGEFELGGLEGSGKWKVESGKEGNGGAGEHRLEGLGAGGRRVSHIDGLQVGGTGTEFTVECNPETVTRELMDVLVAGGVNRVSMGAQSFEARHLKTLERWHSPENVAKALEIARAAGIGRQNVDLIFGIPGQTLAEWESDLRTALGLGTTHLSCYNLTYEPNTAMTARMKRGELEVADEDVEVAMYEATLRAVRARGMERYEVSNYAAPGQECRHNLAYWRGENWLAAGPSASGHFEGNRWKNSARLDDYLTQDDRGFAGIVDWERPDEKRALRERIMTGLRLSEGLDEGWLMERARGVGADVEGMLRVVDRICAGGLAERSAGRVRLTDAGMLLADGLAGELMELV